MKRLIYVISAVILGLGIMILPILLVMPLYEYGQFETTSMEESPYNVKGEEARATEAVGGTSAGAASFPLSLAYAGLVVILGLTVAFSTFMYTRKRVLSLIRRVSSWSANL